MNVNESDYNTLVGTIGVLCGMVLFILISMSIGQLAGIPNVSKLYLINLIPKSLISLAGMFLLIVWSPIFLAGIYTLGHRGVVGMSGHLVNYGIYRYVRNPMYSSLFFIILGLAFVTNSTGILIAGLIWAIVSVFECEREIKGLEKRFGKDYKDYEKNTPLFIPHFIKMLTRQ
ncbi:MAG: isoprenylcysteine carboxylmethyltransferase family protein [bacterium]